MKTAIASLSLFLCTLPCNADAPSDESIRSLFTLMQAESLMESVYASLEPAMRQGLAQATSGKELTAEQQRVLERAPQRMSVLMRTELSWAKLEPMQISIYRDSFEQSEIDGLIDFYRSRLGQTFVNKMPMATQKAITAMQNYMQKVMPKIQAAMQEVLMEAKLSTAK